MDESDATKKRNTETAEQVSGGKQPYRSPVLMEYGSVEDLADSGVVGSTPSSV